MHYEVSPLALPLQTYQQDHLMTCTLYHACVQVQVYTRQCSWPFQHRQEHVAVHYRVQPCYPSPADQTADQTGRLNRVCNSTMRVFRYRFADRCTVVHCSFSKLLSSCFAVVLLTLLLHCNSSMTLELPSNTHLKGQTPVFKFIYSFWGSNM